MITTQQKVSRQAKVATWSTLEDRQPAYALVANVDLVVIRYDNKVSVLYGRCLHRGSLLSDGHIQGEKLICGVHNWDYRYDTGIREYNNEEVLAKFNAWVDLAQDAVYVDEAEIADWHNKNPQSDQRDQYLGLYEDLHGTPEEPYGRYVLELARKSQEGYHGKVTAMGVPITELPRWDDIQFLTAQLARTPLIDEVPVETDLVIGPNAKKPLHLKIPILVSDMSFGTLSEEAKIALAMGAEMAGTGVCSGQGGMLPEEQAANSRYFYELGPGRFGWSLDKVANVQALHFKGGQATNTGISHPLAGSKVVGRIADVFGLTPGQDAVSPARFLDLETPDDFRRMADQVRDVSGGIPIGFKMSAQHIEADIDFALEVGADYIILDGRGGATGSAPFLLKNNISIPTMAALARARRHLDKLGRQDVTLIITGGLRTESDFAKAMALGADGVAIATSAMQAIGCLVMRACHTNNCPVGIATQKKELRARLIINQSAKQLKNFLNASVHMMQILARACGHAKLSDFNIHDLTTWKRDIAYLTGIRYSGVVPL